MARDCRGIVSSTRRDGFLSLIRLSSGPCSRRKAWYSRTVASTSGDFAGTPADIPWRRTLRPRYSRNRHACSGTFRRVTSTRDSGLPAAQGRRAPVPGVFGRPAAASDLRHALDLAHGSRRRTRRGDLLQLGRARLLLQVRLGAAGGQAAAPDPERSSRATPGLAAVGAVRGDRCHRPDGVQRSRHPRKDSP